MKINNNLNCIIDTNVFIQSYRLYYQFSFCPGFWAWLENINQGGILSINKVYDELVTSKDDLSKWVKNKKNFFVDFDNDSLNSYKEIFKFLEGKNVANEKIRDFMSVADAFLVAYAKAHNCILVTHETPSNNLNGKKVKIPDVCIGFGVSYKTIYDLMKMENNYSLELSSKIKK